MERFEGIQGLFGAEALNRFKKSHVCVIGLGGIGSWAAESLVRSGVGQITLVDLDDICVSNINRQVQALESNIGQFKTEVLAKRLREINSDCQVNECLDFFTEKTSEEILKNSFDFMVDAIDQVGCKCHLISECLERKIPLVVTGGTGGKSDLKTMRRMDLSESYNDRLLAQVRKRLRQHHSFPRGNEKKWGIPCIFSYEKSEIDEDFDWDGGARNCQRGYGSISYMTASFGFYSAQIALEYLRGKCE